MEPAALLLTVYNRLGHLTLSLLSTSSLRAGAMSTLQEQLGWLADHSLTSETLGHSDLGLKGRALAPS